MAEREVRYSEDILEGTNKGTALEYVTNDSSLEVSNDTFEAQNISHEITLFAEPIFSIGGFNVTNSLLNSWIAVFSLILFSIFLKNKIKKIPRGIQNFFEIIMESGLRLADSVTGNRSKSEKVFPFVFTIFIFILFNNYLGLFPGIGSIGMVIEHNGHPTFIPYFRGATADLNTTLAFSIMTVVLANIFGIFAIGFWKFFNKFVNLHALTHPFTNFRENISHSGFIKTFLQFSVDLLVGAVKFAVGLIEIVGELAKVASLSFRLFGNIFAGEVLLSSVATIFAFILPVPFMFLEVIVGIVQALVFSILTLVYFSIASMDEEH